ncbi:MAG: hypothetical protein AMXMBFR80_12030 [Dehalococcoidia bacterium]
MDGLPQLRRDAISIQLGNLSHLTLQRVSFRGVLTMQPAGATRDAGPAIPPIPPGW